MGFCIFEEVLDPNGMKIDFHSQMILPSQEVITRLYFHLLTLALVTFEINFSMIWNTFSKDDTSFLKILLFLSHQIAQITNAGVHFKFLQKGHWGKELAMLERCPKCYFVVE